MAKYIVKTASADMPASCWGKYKRVAVLELEPGVKAADVTMISERARGVRRVVRKWERLNVGKSQRCAYERAIVSACALVARLNRPQKFPVFATARSDFVRGDEPIGRATTERGARRVLNKFFDECDRSYSSIELDDKSAGARSDSLYGWWPVYS